jgi:hypothetical protein
MYGKNHSTGQGEGQIWGKITGDTGEHMCYNRPHLGLHAKDLLLFSGILTAVSPKYVLLDGLAVV